MSPDCTCSGSDATISIRNSTGANVLTFIRLCSGTYFGGRKTDQVKFVPGAQMWMQLRGMLDLIARIANEPDGYLGPYQITGGRWDARIGTDMRADEIARILGCEIGQVVDHFGLMVKITTPEPVL